MSYRPLATASVFLMFAFAATLFAGCSRRPSDLSPPLDSPKAFSDSGAQIVPDRWWTAFGDRDLNSLVDYALGSNFDLTTAWYRLQEAQAIADRESSALFPFLDAVFEGQRSHPESEFGEDERLRLGLISEYEVDLWGRIRSSVEAERFRARATIADYQTVALSLSAEVVRTWFQLMESRNQLDLLQEQIETNEKVLKLIKARFVGGQSRSVDIVRQRQLLESTREQKITAESRVGVLENQLAVLLGRPPQEKISYAGKSLPALPPAPETGIPAELVRRRPDVRTAYNLLLAADREMAAAISNQYPRVALTASLFGSGDSAGEIFESWARSISGNLLAPLFDAGLLESEVDRTEAVKNQRIYQYGQTILLSFREVEDALIREKKQIERIKSLEEQVRYARRAYERLRVEYLYGVSNYLDVLTALAGEQRLRRDLLSAKLVLLEFRISLYRALAGGFETPRERLAAGENEKT